MRIRLGEIVPLIVAATTGLVVALAISASGTANQVTLGSTSGTPSGSLCVAGINCTFLPFTTSSNPGLRVPFDGTVTSFSVNAGSAGGAVELRVLRPAPAGQYTGAGTSPPKTLGVGVSTFAISLTVKAGDLLGLDNESSAHIFDTSSRTPITSYYKLPSLADGETTAPDETVNRYRLLLSATVQMGGTTTGTTPGGTTPTGTTPTGSPPTVTGARQSNPVWREGNKLAQFARKRGLPLGTTFSFALNEQASVSFAFTEQAGGRKVQGKCVAQTTKNRRKRACKRTLTRGTLAFAGHSGTNEVSFQGLISRSTKLPLGSYTLVITASDAAGQRSTPKQLSFTIVK